MGDCFFLWGGGAGFADDLAVLAALGLASQRLPLVVERARQLLFRSFADLLSWRRVRADDPNEAFGLLLVVKAEGADRRGREPPPKE